MLLSYETILKLLGHNTKRSCAKHQSNKRMSNSQWNMMVATLCSKVRLVSLPRRRYPHNHKYLESFYNVETVNTAKPSNSSWWIPHRGDWMLTFIVDVWTNITVHHLWTFIMSSQTAVKNILPIFDLKL